MNTPEPTAAEIATQLVSTYLTDAVDELSDRVDPVIDDPKTLGEVMVQLTVIAGESLKLLTEKTTTDPQALLRRLVTELDHAD